MRKIVSIIMIILLLSNSMSVIVKADTNSVTMDIESAGEDGRYVFDGHLLKLVKNDGKIIVENEYNSDGIRVVKRGSEECRFTYDDNKNLIEEERNGKVITYFYEKDEEYEYWHIIGFSYECNNYYYTRDEISRINGIQNENGELVARYEYGDGNNKVETVLKKRGEEWVCTDDSEFVGNVNRIRNRESYYDLECDLYYDNRTFSNASTNKIVWNINENIEILPLSDSYDLDYQIYCWQQSLLNNSTFNESLDKKSDWHDGLSDVAVVARIIYGENASVIIDQNAIANVIRNRAVKKKMTARQVVLENGEFSTATPTDWSYVKI